MWIEAQVLMFNLYIYLYIYISIYIFTVIYGGALQKAGPVAFTQRAVSCLQAF